MESFNKMYLISLQQLEKLETLTPKKTAAENISDKAVAHKACSRSTNGTSIKQPGPGYSKSLQYNDLLQGCQTHFHRGPHQHNGCPQRARCNL